MSSPNKSRYIIYEVNRSRRSFTLSSSRLEVYLYPNSLEFKTSPLTCLVLCYIFAVWKSTLPRVMLLLTLLSLNLVFKFLKQICLMHAEIASLSCHTRGLRLLGQVERNVHKYLKIENVYVHWVFAARSLIIKVCFLDYGVSGYIIFLGSAGLSVWWCLKNVAKHVMLDALCRHKSSAVWHILTFLACWYT